MAEKQKRSDSKSVQLRKGFKRCSSCGTEQGIRKKVCAGVNCGFPFKKKEKDMESIINMSNPNPTHQRGLMEKRADILNIHNDCEVVILMFHKHGSGDTVTFYGTEGAGVSFIGNKEDIPTSEGGEIVIKLFRKFMEDYKQEKLQEKAEQIRLATQQEQEQREHQPRQPQQAQKQQQPQEQQTQPQQEQRQQAQKQQQQPQQQQTQPQQAQRQKQQPQQKQPQKRQAQQQPRKQQSQKQPQQQQLEPKKQQQQQQQQQQVQQQLTQEPQYQQQQLQQQNLQKQPELTPVAYMAGNSIVAAGKLMRERRTLHGTSIPTDHVCVMLTSAQQNYPAPLLLGDESENSVLVAGQFFALPIKSLKLVSKNSNTLHLKAIT